MYPHDQGLTSKPSRRAKEVPIPLLDALVKADAPFYRGHIVLRDRKHPQPKPTISLKLLVQTHITTWHCGCSGVSEKLWMVHDGAKEVGPTPLNSPPFRLINCGLPKREPKRPKLALLQPTLMVLRLKIHHHPGNCG